MALISKSFEKKVNTPIVVVWFTFAIKLTRVSRVTLKKSLGNFHALFVHFVVVTLQNFTELVSVFLGQTFHRVSLNIGSHFVY